MNRYNNIEEVEFALLQTIDFKNDIELTDEDKQRIRNFNGFHFTSDFAIFKVVFVIDESRVLCKDDDNYLWIVPNKNDFKVGDWIGTDDYRDRSNTSQVFKISDEVNEELFDEMRKKINDGENHAYYYFQIDLENVGDELTKDYLVKQIDEQILKRTAKEQEEEKERIAEEKETKKKSVNLKKEYEEQGKGKFNMVNVDGKKIYDGEYIFVLKNDVNKVFTYDYLAFEKKYDFYPIQELIIKKENFEILNNVDFVLVKVDFGVDVFINDTYVPKGKAYFVINRILQYFKHRGILLDGEKIKLLSSLSGMKVYLIEMNKIEVNLTDEIVKMDINFNLIDKENFEVEFADKKKTLDWKFLRDMFYGTSRTSSSRIEQKDFVKMCETFGLTKAEMFDYIRKVKILNEVEESNKDE